jgi:hypothetical protein
MAIYTDGVCIYPPLLIKQVVFKILFSSVIKKSVFF